MKKHILPLLLLLSTLCHANTPRFTIKTAKPYNIFAPADTPECLVTISNTGSGALDNARVSWIARDYSGNIAAQGSDEIPALAPRQEKTWRVTLPQTERESYAVEATLLMQGAPELRAAANVTVLPGSDAAPAASCADSATKFGFRQWYARDEQDAAFLVALMRRIGAGMADAAPMPKLHGDSATSIQRCVTREFDLMLNSTDDEFRAYAAEELRALAAARADRVYYRIIVADGTSLPWDDYLRAVKTAAARVVAFKQMRDALGLRAEFYGCAPKDYNMFMHGNHWDQKDTGNGRHLDGIALSRVDPRYRAPNMYGIDRMFFACAWAAQESLFCDRTPFSLMSFDAVPRADSNGFEEDLFLKMIAAGFFPECSTALYCALQDGTPADHAEFDTFSRGLAERGLWHADRGLLREPQSDGTGADVKPALLAFQFAAELVSRASSQVLTLHHRSGLCHMAFTCDDSEPAALLLLNDPCGVLPERILSLTEDNAHNTALDVTLATACERVVVRDILGRVIAELAPVNGTVTLTVTERPLVVFGVSSLILSANGVAHPATVRYAWDDYPECNLVNAEGLPCGPFELRTNAN